VQQSSKEFYFCPLASGSKGNAIYVATEKTKILIDAGIATKTIRERLKMLGTSLEEIDAILISHEHIDHVQALPLLSGKHGIPILANMETAQAIERLFNRSFRYQIFSTNETFEFKDLAIHPFSVQHDAQDPVAFTLQHSVCKLGICTDLGFVTTLVTRSLQDCDYLIVEANHEPSMVHASPRPTHYKERVLGNQGHLSNAECAHLVSMVLSKLKHIHLAHLSSECNHPELAQKIVHQKLKESGATVEVSIAHQDQLSRAIEA
jgi:phosphoribosyl 1,2-cyclic phosphodiesterase